MIFQYIHKCISHSTSTGYTVKLVMMDKRVGSIKRGNIFSNVNLTRYQLQSNDALPITYAHVCTLTTIIARNKKKLFTLSACKMLIL